MNTIHEGIIDKRIRQTVEWSKSSDLTLKFACIAVSPIVGNYTHATKQIADARNRHVSTIENWAHAHWLYLDLRKSNPHPVVFQHIRDLWHNLPASHWWLAYDIQLKGYDALHYLGNAYLNIWSGRRMMEEHRKDMEAGNAPMVLARAFVAFQGLAAELMKPLPALERAEAEGLLRKFMDLVK